MVGIRSLLPAFPACAQNRMDSCGGIETTQSRKPRSRSCCCQLGFRTAQALGLLGHDDTKWSSLPLEIRSSNFEIRNKSKILISKSRKCTACKLARVEFSIWDI